MGQRIDRQSIEASDKNRATPGTESHSIVWVRLNAISTLALALLALFALIFTYIQIREMRRNARAQINEMRSETQAQHLAELIDKFDSPTRMAIRKSLAEKRIDKAEKRLHQLKVDDEPVELDEELDFCENIGLLTDRGYLDRHDVWDLFGLWLFDLYADARPYLDSLQSPADYKECKNLVESIRPIEIKEGAGTYDHPNEQQLYGDYLQNIEKSSGEPPTGRARQKH